MLANQDDTIDRKLLAAERERLLHRAEDRHAILLRHWPAHVVLRYMLSKHGSDLRTRIGRLVVLVIAFQVFADHYVGMRTKPVFGEDGGDSFRRAIRGGRR